MFVCPKVKNHVSIGKRVRNPGNMAEGCRIVPVRLEFRALARFSFPQTGRGRLGLELRPEPHKRNAIRPSGIRTIFHWHGVLHAATVLRAGG